MYFLSRNAVITISKFFCTQCGAEGFPLPRKTRKIREPGHLKILYCLNCKQETNHVEVRDNGKYTYEDFQIEFLHGNFTNDGIGTRIEPHWKKFVNETLEKEGLK